MVQLTLLPETRRLSVREAVLRCAEQASASGVSAETVARAVSATSRRFHAGHDSGAGSVDEERIRAYFRAVVRRRVLNADTDADLRRRTLAQSIAADLRSAGWGEPRIEAEVRRVLGPEAAGAYAA